MCCGTPFGVPLIIGRVPAVDRGVGHGFIRRQDRRRHRGRLGHGTRARRPTGGGGMLGGHVRSRRRGRRRDGEAGDPGAERRPDHHASLRRIGTRTGEPVPRRGHARPSHRPREPGVQQRRHRWRWQLPHRPARPVGPDLRRVLGWRLQRQPGLRATARGQRRRIPREHEQRERVPRHARAGRTPHRVQRREVRGEGLQRSVDRGSAHERAAREGRRRHARPHRHRHRAQQPARGWGSPRPRT